MIQFSIFVEGKQISQVSEGEAKEISIGRSPGCVIRLPDPGISRLHATVKHSRTGWVLEKKSQYGGLAVNGQEVENAVLQGGEEIIIGNFVMRVNVSDEAKAAAAPAQEKSGLTPGLVDVKPAAGRKEATGTGNIAPGREPGAETKELAAPPVYQAGESSRTNIARNLAVGYLRFEPGAANVTEYVIKKDRVLLGRASTCDIVLYEKKASRKHIEIRREGLSFYLKDLGSANGTFVNEKRVDAAELIAGDAIKVGDSRFEFSIENKEFFAKRDQFMPVPLAALPAGGASEAALSGERTNAGQNAIAGLGIPDVGGGTGSISATEHDDIAQEKSLLKKRWKQFWKLPRQKRIAIILAAAIILPFLFADNEPKKAGPARVVRDKDGTIIRRFENLSDKNKKIVLGAYKEILAARTAKDYQKMLDNSMTILRLVTDYKDTKIYQAEAQRGLEEEEKRNEEEKVRKFQEQLALEVAQLVVKAEKVFQEALEKPEKRAELDILIQEIYTKDPNNTTAQSWQARIKQKLADEARERDLAEQEKRLKETAEAEFAKLEDLFLKEKYVDALQFAETLPKIGYTKDGFLERVETKNAEIRQKLASVIDPLLEVAERERLSNGDLVKAKEHYNKVLAVDPENQKALEGQEAIRNVLHLRAKRLYAQAILAESVTSLDEARMNLMKCLQVAPDKDPYRRRCEAKLEKYEAFTKEEQ